MITTGDLRIDTIMPRLNNSWLRLPFEDCLSGKSSGYKKFKKKEIKPDGKIAVIDQGEELIAGYTDEDQNAYAGSLPVIIFGDHTRRIKYIDFKFAVGADGTKLLHPFKPLSPKFFFYYLKTLNLESQGYSRHYRFLKQIQIPVPPINEQNQIVAKLEKLLAKVDKCKERMDKIPAILKRFRQSVLVEACSGRLTEDWRKANTNVETGADFLEQIKEYRKKKGLKKEIAKIVEPVDYPVSWIKAELSFFIESMANGIYKPGKYYSDDGIVCLRMYNIQRGKVVWENLKKMILTAQEIDKYRLENGDILVNRVNSRELVGKAALIRKIKQPVIFESKNIRLRLIEKTVMPVFINYCFLTRTVRDVFEGNAKQTVGMATISQPQIAKLLLPIPPIVEQHEIVRRVEVLFKVADRIETRYEKARAHVEKLTQSILAKAFRGELVPQDPNDEPASKLLERIKAERENQAGEKKPSFKRKPSANRKKSATIKSETQPISKSQIVNGNGKSIPSLKKSVGKKSPPERRQSSPSANLERQDIMAAFRKACRGRGKMDRTELLKQVSIILGYQRLTQKIKIRLKGDMRAAMRRGIVKSDRGLMVAATRSIDDYERERLIKAVCSVMKKGYLYDRETVIRESARHLGFARITETVKKAFQSAIRAAVRNGIIAREKHGIIRP